MLEPTSVRARDEILDAIDGMRAGGSTNLQSGLDTGYDVARRAFREDGVNRVIVVSDDLANAGITNVNELSSRIRCRNRTRHRRVRPRRFNYTTMEQLADQGDGFYPYVDTIEKAERLFEDELTATLITAAIDAKIQVEFDDSYVDEYRLIGYENRGVLDQDFRNDEVDAGELGAGHQATAIYEIRLARGVSIDDRAELAVVRLRWEDPETREVEEIDERTSISGTSSPTGRPCLPTCNKRSLLRHWPRCCATVRTQSTSTSTICTTKLAVSPGTSTPIGSISSSTWSMR